MDIWSKDKKGKPTQIINHRMMKEYADGLKNEWFSNPDQNKELLKWFFQNGPGNLRRNGEYYVEDLFQTDFRSMDEVQNFVQQVYSYFEHLLIGDGAGLYLSPPHRPQDYLSAAERMTSILPEENRNKAAARIAITSMVLSRYPDNLPSRIRQAMLSCWRQQADNVKSVTTETEVQFGWENLNPSKSPRLVVISNPTTDPVALKLKTPWGPKSIWVPAGSKITAVYVGQVMTSIKGGLCLNPDFSACLQDGCIVKYRLSRNKVFREPLSDPDGLWDLALCPDGRIHRLEGYTAKIWDGQELWKLSDVIGIYAWGEMWLVHTKDGNTVSNYDRMVQEDVIAVAQDEQDTLLLTRSGQVHSLFGRSATLETFFHCMFDRFSNLDDDIAERIVYQGEEIVRTKAGEMLCRNLIGSGV